MSSPSRFAPSLLPSFLPSFLPFLFQCEPQTFQLLPFFFRPFFIYLIISPSQLHLSSLLPTYASTRALCACMRDAVRLTNCVMQVNNASKKKRPSPFPTSTMGRWLCMYNGVKSIKSRVTRRGRKERVRVYVWIQQVQIITINAGRQVGKWARSKREGGKGKAIYTYNRD